MKTLLVGINAKYIHSNLAIRYLEQYIKENVKEKEIDIDIIEFTINQSIDYMINELYKLKPDVIGLSCYIWNINVISDLIKTYKKVCPDVTICLGGPETSYDYEYIKKVPEIDAIICGEGEETFTEYLLAINKQESIKDIKGLMFIENGQVVVTQHREAMDLSKVPFVYYDKLGDFNNRIIYYESIRGCPFNCQYCLSSVESGVRYRDIELVKKELKYFLDNNVMQVKFVDRTFNCSKKHSMEIWKFLHENDNGTTNFHFEISADILDEETIKFLSTVREGLFQFEIGVQSTNIETLTSIKRETDLNILFENVRKLSEPKNIHLHLDLIAGLPNEDYNSFKESFNEVYKLRPEKVQMGFLKVLKGSGIQLNEKKYGIVYRDYAPYEVLYTKDISFKELLQLKLVEDMVDKYYNSGQFIYTIQGIETYYDTPFELYKDLAVYWESKGFNHLQHSKTALYTILHSFCKEMKIGNMELIEDLLKFDLCLREKLKKYPEWLNQDDNYKSKIIDFYKDEGNISTYLPELGKYTSKQISRMAHIECFRYDVTKLVDIKNNVFDKKDTFILFNYHNRDKMRHNARYFKVKLS